MERMISNELMNWKFNRFNINVLIDKPLLVSKKIKRYSLIDPIVWTQFKYEYIYEFCPICVLVTPLCYEN